MAAPVVTHEHLAMLLQAARDFSFEQMARGERLIPFAARATPKGDIVFSRYAEPDSAQSLDEIYAITQRAVAAEAEAGGLLAAALVATVKLDPPEGSCSQAIRVHIEAPGHCREVLVPFAVAQNAARDGVLSLSEGEMVALEAEVQLFTA